MYMTDFEMLDRNTMDLFKINDSEHYCDSNKIAVCSILMKPPLWMELPLDIHTSTKLRTTLPMPHKFYQYIEYYIL